MSDAATIPETPPDRPDPKPSLLSDPVVRILIYVSIGIVILILVTAISVLGTGVTEKTGPRSLAEKELLVASSQLTPQTVGDAWAPYINALAATGDTARAKVALNQARASVTGTMTTPGLDLAEARMVRNSGDYVNAVNLADSAMKGYKAKFLALLVKSGEASQTTTGFYGEDYFNASLVKAYSLQGLGRWKDAVALFDAYLLNNPTASDIYIDAAKAKLKLGDKSGAEKYFKAALKFVPYDEEAKAGLKQMGVSQ